MLNVKDKLFFLVSNFLVLFLPLACNSVVNDEVSITDLTRVDKCGICPCKAEIFAKHFGVNRQRKYLKGKLTKSGGCTAEGLYLVDYMSAGVEYSTEDKIYENLSLGFYGKVMKVFDREVVILEQRSDSFLTQSISDSSLKLVVISHSIK